ACRHRLPGPSPPGTGRSGRQRLADREWAPPPRLPAHPIRARRPRRAARDLGPVLHCGHRGPGQAGMADHRLTAKASTHAPARVDAYLGELAHLLRGPRRHRARILAELRDGLDHAIADHTTHGRTEHQAAESAIDHFGTPQAVADAFSGELATAYARHTIAWYITAGPLVGIWWLLLLQPHPWRTGLLALLAAIPVIPLITIAIATAAGTFATTGRLIRWLPEASPDRALTATIAIAGLALVGDLTVITLYLRSAVPVEPLAILATGASLIRIAGSMITLHHPTMLRRSNTPQAPQRPDTGRHDARR